MRRTITRRKLIQGTALTAGAAVFGPWKFNRVYAAPSDKPILIGLTHDASGQFANSGQAEKRGTIMAIEEANAAGGVPGIQHRVGEYSDDYTVIEITVPADFETVSIAP